MDLTALGWMKAPAGGKAAVQAQRWWTGSPAADGNAAAIGTPSSAGPTRPFSKKRRSSCERLREGWAVLNPGSRDSAGGGCGAGALRCSAFV